MPIFRSNSSIWIFCWGLLVGSILPLLLGFTTPAGFPLLARVQSAVQSQYVDPDIDHNALEYGAIRGYLSAIKDPYTRFVEPDTVRSMQNRLKGETAGVGMTLAEDDHRIFISRVLPGAPADRSGLRRGDQIIGIDRMALLGASISDASVQLRGPVGSLVRIDYARGRYRQTVWIERAITHVSPVDQTAILGQVGYVRLTSFESLNTAQAVKNAVIDLRRQGATHLILDLRNNGGGLLSSGVAVAGLFLDNQVIVTAVDRLGRQTPERSSSNAPFLNMPIAVLVNGATASSAEIVAGAIKDHRRGIVVGSNTYGKASMQRFISLPDGSGVLLTFARYYTPAGIDISKVGVGVDVPIQSKDYQGDRGTVATDPVVAQARRQLLRLYP